MVTRIVPAASSTFLAIIQPRLVSEVLPVRLPHSDPAKDTATLDSTDDVLCDLLEPALN